MPLLLHKIFLVLKESKDIVRSQRSRSINLERLFFLCKGEEDVQMKAERRNQERRKEKGERRNQERRKEKSGKEKGEIRKGERKKEKGERRNSR